MKFTTLIPLRFNDGTEVPPMQLTRIIDDLAFQFRGCSDEGVTKGQWLEEAQQAVIKIGIELGQLAMYFEVRDYDGVQLLEVPQPKKGKRN